MYATLGGEGLLGGGVTASDAAYFALTVCWYLRRSEDNQALVKESGRTDLHAVPVSGIQSEEGIQNAVLDDLYKGWAIGVVVGEDCDSEFGGRDAYHSRVEASHVSFVSNSD